MSLFLRSCLFPQPSLVIALSVGIDEPIDIGVEQAIRGVEEYIEKVNQRGGVNGKRVELEIFNDSNNPEQAQDVAQEIAQNSNALVVLGHYYSSTSVTAGKIYQEFGLPAITGGATADEVTKGNDWYFRTRVNGSSQMSFLAFYLKQVLGYSTVSLIYDGGEEYSHSVSKAFERGAAQHQVTIQNQWNIAADNEADLNQKIETIVSELTVMEPEEVGLIVILTIEDPAVKIVSAIKRQGLSYQIVGGDKLSSGTFVQRFQKYPEELEQPGYFTDGIYSVSQLVFDVLDESAQKFRSNYITKYNQEPSWVTATFYNAAKVAVAALKRAEVTGDPSLLVQERLEVRNQMAMMNSLDSSIEGLNGPIYFDPDGDSSPSMVMSVIVNNQSISTLEQLTPRAVSESQDELAADLSQGWIVQFGDQFLNRTDVVYTGIRPRHISNLNLEQKTFELDFDLWFRYRSPEGSHIHPPITDIHFLNLVGDIKLDQPAITVEKNNITYDLYQVSGTFNLDFLDHKRNFEEHILGLNFINNQISKSHLLYVIDSLGLSPVDDQSLVEILQKDQVLSSDTGWKIEQATFFQDSAEQETLGDPRVLTNQGTSAQFSRFNLSIVISRKQIIFRRKMTHATAIYFLPLAFVLILLNLLQKHYHRFKVSPQLSWVLRISASLSLLLSTEVVLIQSLKRAFSSEYLEFIVIFFDILWWVIPAYFLGEYLECFLWQPLAKKTGQPIPTLVHRMALTVVYLLTFYCVVAYVFGKPLTSLLATSGLALTIIGLAIQINISNIFSGLAINLERAFQVGDYIEIIDEGIKGYVADITWRATHIETASGNIVLIPNSAINDKTIINYMRPQTISRATIPFTLTQDTPSDLAIDIFAQALSATIEHNPQSLLAEPPPEVLIGGADALGIIYELNFWYIPADTNLEQSQNLVARSVLKHLDKANIELARGDED
ncbi:MAG: ABC transporter substrate-binding protein [Cyanobacteria bacterium P01_F01_bin.143]